MSFCSNNSQQITFSDSTFGLTERELRRLKGSWAETFSNKIFPLINEQRFSVLYSDNPASRPNNPTNVYIGLLMLKAMFDLNDDEAFEEIMFDIRFQYALRTTSFEEQPISQNSLSNFRRLVYQYNLENGVDLIQEEIESHAKVFTKLLKIDGDTIRMDSLMISSSCKNLSRLELIYSCIERVVKDISKQIPEQMPTKFSVYLKDSNRNDVIYRSKDKALTTKLQGAITDALELYNLFAGSKMSTGENFLLLSRILGEQANISEGLAVLKENKEIAADSLQNPTDPDATFREKSGEDNTGYVGNVVETFDGENAIITSYDLQPNTYSDYTFSEDEIAKLGKQEQTLTMIVDGAYYSENILEKATANNINMIPTALTGRATVKDGSENFTIDFGKFIVTACPEGYCPNKSSCNSKGECRATFLKDICDSCENKPNCPLIPQKKTYLFKTSRTKQNRLKLMEQMDTREYKAIADKRAGVEGLPSVLRRRYGIDCLPVRGLVRSKVWLGLKIGAINIKRVVKAILSTENVAICAQKNCLLSQIFGFQEMCGFSAAA
jgi:hypothetical protein